MCIVPVASRLTEYTIELRIDANGDVAIALRDDQNDPIAASAIQYQAHKTLIGIVEDWRRSPEEYVGRFDELLGAALFAGKVGQYFLEHHNGGRLDGELLRIWIETTEPSLQRLPWEIAKGPGEYGILSAREEISVMRRPTDTVRIASPSPLTRALKVTFLVGPHDCAVADVRGLRLGPLKPPNTLQMRLQSELDESYSVELTDANEDNLKTAMSESDVVHFHGHGVEERDGHYLAFSRPNSSEAHLFSPQSVPVQSGGPRIALVVACQSGEPMNSAPVGFTDTGVPVVIAMQRTVSEDTALKFCEAFYKELATGTLDSAVFKGRRAMESEIGGNPRGTPVVYCRYKGGPLVMHEGK